MPVNKERLELYLDQIRSEVQDMQAILGHSDKEILAGKHNIKSLKYSIIIITEAIGSSLQHILAKEHNIVINGFSEAVNKAKNENLLTSSLIDRLLPFIRFRNMLVHQYWKIDDQKFLQQLRTGQADFKQFIREISACLSNLDSEPTKSESDQS